MVLCSVGTVPDLFGNVKHMFSSDKYDAWIMHFKDDSFTITIFDKERNVAITNVNEDNKTALYDSYNIAYIQLLDKITQIESNKNKEKYDN